MTIKIQTPAPFSLAIERSKKIIQEDDGSNWDIQEYHSLEDLIEDIDNGFGILNLKK
jgi:hypothetical protein